MSTNETNSDIQQEELSEDKAKLLRKLSIVFDFNTAEDFVRPKTFETRKHLTLEDLKNVNYEQPDERLQRLRSMAHYQTTTQSLDRSDLEASYQAFVRSQINHQQISREELEQFVRNSADIDAAKRFIEGAHEISPYPLQPQLLFHSSKLNEQRAKLLKSVSTHKSLKDMHDNLILHELFPETSFIRPAKSAPKPKEFLPKKSKDPRPQSVHIEHHDRKYHITFLKDSNTLECLPKLSRYGPTNPNVLVMKHRTAASLFGTDSSTIQGLSTASTITKIHREIFPPLSIAALREYRPTLAPKVSTVSTIRPNQQQSRRKEMLKTDFIWEQSIVSPKT